MKIKKTNLYFVLVLALVIASGFILLKGESSEQGNIIISDGEVQKITLSTKNLNYYPNTINVKAGQPVSLTLDDSVSGCLRSFTIKDLGVSKYVRTPEETIDFTPTKKGTFAFTCSMGMGYGKIIVD